VILNLILFAVLASVAIGTLVGALGRLANRDRTSQPADTFEILPVRHTEEERQAALAELAPMTDEERTEEEWAAEWHLFWASHEETARHGEQFLNRILDGFAPGWRDAICERRDCTLCVRDFAEAMEVAGVIALPDHVVDWDTAEYAAVTAA
jgi:hypothetical protein